MRKEGENMKKLLAILLSILMVLLIFASCDTGGEEKSSEPVSEVSSLEVSTKEISSAHQHEYTKDVIDATCVDRGYTVNTCACGYSFEGDWVKAKGHDFRGDLHCFDCGSRATSRVDLFQVLVNHVTEKGTYDEELNQYAVGMIFPQGMNGQDVFLQIFYTPDESYVTFTSFVYQCDKRGYACYSGFNLRRGWTSIFCWYRLLDENNQMLAGITGEFDPKIHKFGNAFPYDEVNVDKMEEADLKAGSQDHLFDLLIRSDSFLRFFDSDFSLEDFGLKPDKLLGEGMEWLQDLV